MISNFDEDQPVYGIQGIGPNGYDNWFESILIYFLSFYLFFHLVSFHFFVSGDDIGTVCQSFIKMRYVHELFIMVDKDFLFVNFHKSTS